MPAGPTIAPMNGINYYERVRDVLRGKRGHGHDESYEELRDFYRVFMVPGMAHCSGGEGANAFGNGTNGPVIDEDHDLLRALEAWVEHGVASQDHWHALREQHAGERRRVPAAALPVSRD